MSWLAIRRALAVIMAALFSLGVFVAPREDAAQADVGATPDAWSSPILLRAETDSWFVSPVHASLLPNGSVHIMGLGRPQDLSDISPEDPHDPNTFRSSAFVFEPHQFRQPVPDLISVREIPEPVDFSAVLSDGWNMSDDLFCSGHTFLSDGRLFTVGGTRSYANNATEELRIEGLSYATIFSDNGWGRVPNEMVVTGSQGTTRRWYPTATRLHDEQIYVTGGFEFVIPTGIAHPSTEKYNPESGNWTAASALSSTPVEIINSDYTHVFQLPYQLDGRDLLMFGEPGSPILGSSATSSDWHLPPHIRPQSEEFVRQRMVNGGRWDAKTAPNNGASSLLLPIRLNNGEWGYNNGSVLVAGGAHGTPHSQAVDVYDPVASTWLSRINAGLDRHHPSTVSLPDGRILIINGHGEHPAASGASYIDPTQGLAYSLGTGNGVEMRGYHSIALLLPDGSVLVGGGRGPDTLTSFEKPTLRYYYPHYMFLARPRLEMVPGEVAHNSTFVVDTVGSRPPSEMVLVSLGSMTHSFDMNQRSVQIRIAKTFDLGGGRFRSVLVSPPDGRVAPSGHYMLFALDAGRVPSEAQILRVGP